MVGNMAFQSQPAKPAVCQVEIDFLAQPPFRTDAAAVADDQHADHQLRIARGATDRAVERRQSVPQTAKVEKTVDLPQQVIGRNPIFQAKLIEKRRRIVALLPHHGRCPRSAPSSTESQATPAFKPPFSTKSAESGHRHRSVQTGTRLRRPRIGNGRAILYQWQSPSPGEPHVLEAPAVEDAVGHDCDALDVRLPACRRPKVVDDRASDIFL